MNREQIAARIMSPIIPHKLLDEVEAIVREAVEAEREACASIVENADTPDCGGWSTCGISEAIRARGEVGQ